MAATIIEPKKSEKPTKRVTSRVTRMASEKPSGADVGGTITDATEAMVTTAVMAMAVLTNAATSRATVKAMTATDAITATDVTGRFLSRLTYKITTQNAVNFGGVLVFVKAFERYRTRSMCTNSV